MHAILQSVVQLLHSYETGCDAQPELVHKWDLRCNHCIHVHLKICGGHWIACAVWVCESIQECVERALHELNKRLLDWVLLAATQNAVLKNVRDAFAVFNWRPEHGPKGLVLITVQQRHDLRPCSQMQYVSLFHEFEDTAMHLC